MNINAGGSVNISAGRDVNIIEGVKPLLSSESEDVQKQVLAAIEELQAAIKAKDVAKSSKLMDAIWKVVPSIAGSVISKLITSMM